jgi:hypothetical protein
MTDPARIAKLVRLLASESDGEVLTAARMLKKLTNLNDLGNQIEHGSGGLSDRDKQLIRNAAYQEGLQDGIKKGQRNARPQKPFNTSFEESVRRMHVHAGSSTIQADHIDMVHFCVDHRPRLRPREREFIDSLVFRLEATNTLSEKQRVWLADIYERLGGQ